MAKINIVHILNATVAASVLMVTTAAAAFNMHDAVYQTLKNHPDILSAQAESSAAKSDIRTAQGGLYPSLDLSAGFGRENSNNPATRATGSGSRVFTRREAEALLQQLIFDGGNVRGTIKQRRYDWQASLHRINELQQSLAFATVATYHDVLRNRELLSVRKLDVKAHKEMLAKVERRLAAGAGRKSEISLAKSRVALSVARLELTQGDLHNSRDTFNKLVGQPVPGNMQNPGRPRNIPRSLRAARQIALDNNPSIKLLSAQAQSLNAAIGVAQSAFYPRFTLDLSKTYNNNLDGVAGRNEDALAMVRMTYNILRGGSDVASVRAAQNRERSGVEGLANIKRDVFEDVALSWNDLQTAKDRLTYLKQHRDESLAVYDAYVKQFQLGQRTLFDLLNAQSEYYDASTNYINGRYDIQTNSYRLLASEGVLVDTLSQGDRAMEKAADQLYNYKSPMPARARYVSNGRSGRYPMHAKKARSKGTATADGTAKEIKAIMGDRAGRATPSTSSKTQAAAKATNALPKAQKMAKKNTASKVVTTQKIAKSNPISPSKLSAINASSHYVLQLYSANYKSAAQRFIDANHLKSAIIEQAQANGKTVYRVVSGDFADKYSAWNAINTMPKAVQQLQPLVRYVSAKLSDEVLV